MRLDLIIFTEPYTTATTFPRQNGGAQARHGEVVILWAIDQSNERVFCHGGLYIRNVLPL